MACQQDRSTINKRCDIGETKMYSNKCQQANREKKITKAKRYFVCNSTFASILTDRVTESQITKRESLLALFKMWIKKIFKKILSSIRLAHDEGGVVAVVRGDLTGARGLINL